MITTKDIHGNNYEIDVKDLAWRPSAYGIVIHEDSILLVKEGGKYHLPGGGVELGEDPIAAVIREVKEEAGIIVTNPKLINSASAFFTWVTPDQPPKLTHVHSLLFYYACDYSGGNLGDAQPDDYEKLAGLKAEWLAVADLSDIIVGTTVDWRPVVNQFLDTKSP